MYDASVAIHVVAALVGFGVTFSYPVIQLVAERRGPDALALGFDAILAISRWVAVPATLLVGVTGVFQLADGPYSLHDAWLAASLGLYLAVMAVAVLRTGSSRRGSHGPEPAGKGIHTFSASSMRSSLRPRLPSPPP